MWLNPQFSADLVTFNEEIYNGKLHFLCSGSGSWYTATPHWRDLFIASNFLTCKQYLLLLVCINEEWGFRNYFSIVFTDVKKIVDLLSIILPSFYPPLSNLSVHMYLLVFLSGLNSLLFLQWALFQETTRRVCMLYDMVLYVLLY